MKIIVMGSGSEYFDDVIKLGNANSSTLGFLPRGAYENYASQGKIFVAVEDKNVLGYLLYNINRGGMFAYISHLCVDGNQRCSGVGRMLVDELKRKTRDLYRGIRVRCRRDWEARKVWPKYNFVPKNEIRGRSKEGSTLTVWWYDHGHPDLFRLAEEQRLKSKVKVVIDANVFFDLHERTNPTNRESHALLADWLQEDIELCLTSEIFNEIDRNDDGEQRKSSRAFAESFFIIPDSDDDYQKAKQDLKFFFPSDLDEQDASDLCQLARTIAGNVHICVTRDEGLLDKADAIYNRFGIRVIRPTDLIIRQDSLARESEYQPARLAGSRIETRRVQPEQTVLLQEHFRAPQEETKSAFRDRLQTYLSDPYSFQAEIIQNVGSPLALIAYNKQSKVVLEIPILRIAKGSLAPTLARYIVYRMIMAASQEKKRVLIKVTDNYLSEDIIFALRENGFVSFEQMWLRPNLSLVEEASTVVKILQDIGKRFPDFKPYFEEVRKSICFAIDKKNKHALFRAEKSLWPTKILDLTMPSFVVSIHPTWAMNLFDSEIAKQDLFGSKPRLILSLENVYYRSKRPQVLEAPARILWYVTKGTGNYQGVQSIKACSYLDEIVIDKPKPLFSRFQRLGIFTWEDILDVANNDLEQEVMAFRFSNTELFENPIDLQDLRKIWLEETRSSFHLQAPRRISSKLFFRLYSIGTESQSIGDIYA